MATAISIIISTWANSLRRKYDPFRFVSMRLKIVCSTPSQVQRAELGILAELRFQFLFALLQAHNGAAMVGVQKISRRRGSRTWRGSVPEILLRPWAAAAARDFLINQ